MIIKVKAFPNSRENKVIELERNYFEVRVKERAENNDANFAILKILAEYLKISKAQIKFVSGIKSRNKVLEVN